jgi:hypothetical protein
VIDGEERIHATLELAATSHHRQCWSGRTDARHACGRSKAPRDLVIARPTVAGSR